MHKHRLGACKRLGQLCEFHMLGHDGWGEDLACCIKQYVHHCVSGSDTSYPMAVNSPWSHILDASNIHLHAMWREKKELPSYLNFAKMGSCLSFKTEVVFFPLRNLLSTFPCHLATNCRCNLKGTLICKWQLKPSDCALANKLVIFNMDTFSMTDL